MVPLSTENVVECHWYQIWSVRGHDKVYICIIIHVFIDIRGEDRRFANRLTRKLNKLRVTFPDAGLYNYSITKSRTEQVSNPWYQVCANSTVLQWRVCDYQPAGTAGPYLHRPRKDGLCPIIYFRFISPRNLHIFIYSLLLLLSIGPRWLMPRKYCSHTGLLYYP